MTISSISSSVLLAYLQAKSGVLPSTGTSSASATLAAAAPVAPWKSGTTSTTSSSATTSVNTLVEQILGGQQIVNPTATPLSQTTSNTSANTDYQKLFALYQGLTSLQSLATAAGQSDITSTQLSLLQTAFSDGLSQVRSFISGGPFQEFAVSNGTISTSDTTSVGVGQSSDGYTSVGLVNNTVNALVPGLQGNAAFSMTATNALGKNPVTVNFNLANMGSTPRTLANVVTYLNSQLKAAGLKTRFADNLIPGTPASTSTSGTTPVVTPATPDQYGLQIDGSANELLSFAATGSTPAVYIGQTSTDPTATSTTSSTTATTTSALTLSTTTSSTATTAPALTSQVIKLDTPASAGGATTRGFTDDLPAGSVVKATATAPDGSLYVLANVTSTTNGQTIQGQQDAALLKYDSAGNLIYTKTLGAADTATASALAVSADGSQAAVAGSITGSTLDPTDTSQQGSTTAQSFVSVYDASGDPLWNKVQDATADNQVNAVTFGANNSVYVVGSTSGRLPGATASGGQDGYVEGFSATAVSNTLAMTTTWTPKVMFTQEFGTIGVDRATGVAVSNGAVYVSSVENGDAVVRRYDVSASTSTSGAVTTSATLGAKQDLGGVAGGDVTGLAVAADGSIVVAGSTHNAALNAGTVTSAYSGNGDAFVADLNAQLNPAGAEKLAYYNAGGPTTATALTLSGNDAYITGQIAGASKYTRASGYGAALNLTSGATDWSSTFSGNNGSAEPDSIAVSATGASVLDALGLPQGALAVQNQPSQLLTANSSLIAGDSFYVQSGSGVAQKISIDPNETYSSLAHKIEVASGFTASATTVTVNGQQQLRIAPAIPSASIRIEAGPAGQDALQSLGLREGLISQSALTASTSTSTTTVTATGATPTSNVKTHYQITVPNSLSLATTTGAQSAATALATAIAEVQGIYSDMTTAKTTATLGNTNGAVPAYITAQISNYQLALQRLTGGTSSSSSSNAALALLGG